MITYHLLAITIALLIDSIVGDPPHWPHPVRWLGNFISFLEKRLNKGQQKRNGIFLLLIVIILSFLLSFVVVGLAYLFHPVVGVIMEGVLIAVTISQKSLQEAAFAVYIPLLERDEKEARKQLSYIVGRDTAHLNEVEMTRATVETVAENTADGITSPLFWAFIGGAPLAVVYRAINTCDSMIGYDNERFASFGWAAAKLDDIVNWIPSRLTGAMMLLVMKPKAFTRLVAWNIWKRDAKKHVSPNSGWCEAAAAVVLGVQLGGTNTYKGVVSKRATMGEPIYSLHAKHIKEIILLMKRTIILFLIFLWVGGIIIEITSTWCQSALFIR